MQRACDVHMTLQSGDGAGPCDRNKRWPTPGDRFTAGRTFCGKRHKLNSEFSVNACNNRKGHFGISPLVLYRDTVISRY